MSDKRMGGLGFTLVEVLITVTILSLGFIGVTKVVFGFIDRDEQLRAQEAVNYNIRTVFNRIENLVGTAEDIAFPSVDGSSAAELRLGPVNSCTDSAVDCVRLTGENLEVSEGGNAAALINSSDVAVTEFDVQAIHGSSDSGPKTVRIIIKIRYIANDKFPVEREAETVYVVKR